jgi:hypothetical protein
MISTLAQANSQGSLLTPDERATPPLMPMYQPVQL